MFLSESIVRAIHTDRVRDIERATRERRLIDATAEPVVAVQPGTSPRGLPAATSARSRRTGVAV
jgi:hypothetical protein